MNPQKAPHLRTGQQGEAVAVGFLQEKGFEILCQNFRFKRAEIDIVAKRNDTLVFIEVKTRKNLSFGMPESFVSAQKAALVTKAADHYIHLNDWHGNIRYDIVSVVFSYQTTEIEHFEDAFY